MPGSCRKSLHSPDVTLSQASHAMQRKQSGFTYLGLMFLIGFMGLMMAAASAVWIIAQQRDKERELLFVGREFRRAIEAYHRAGTQPGPSTAIEVSGNAQASSPATPSELPVNSAANAIVQRYPESLEDLLLDKRVPFIRRYLRKIYPDPMTGSFNWGLIRDPQGGIIGVYSQSQKKPIRMVNFFGNENFGEVNSYRDWVFGIEDARIQRAEESKKQTE